MEKYYNKPQNYCLGILTASGSFINYMIGSIGDALKELVGEGLIDLVI